MLFETSGHSDSGCACLGHIGKFNTKMFGSICVALPKVGKVGKVGKVVKVPKVGKVGKVPKVPKVGKVGKVPKVAAKNFTNVNSAKAN
jgi:hypothetical protein